jgi:hypothetical protein
MSGHTAKPFARDGADVHGQGLCAKVSPFVIVMDPEQETVLSSRYWAISSMRESRHRREPRSTVARRRLVASARTAMKTCPGTRASTPRQNRSAARGPCGSQLLPRALSTDRTAFGALRAISRMSRSRRTPYWRSSARPARLGASHWVRFVDVGHPAIGFVAHRLRGIGNSMQQATSCRRRRFRRRGAVLVHVFKLDARRTVASAYS